MANQRVIVPQSVAPVLRGVAGVFETVWYLFFQAIGLQIPQIGDCILQAAGDVSNYYLACDGSAVSRTVYADLFAVIGVLYGPGDGLTTFNLPPNVPVPTAPGFWKIRYR